jgi:hypothetical protein
MYNVNGLVGSWISSGSDLTNWARAGGERIEFYPDGNLTYFISQHGSIRAITLKYIISGRDIITYRSNGANVDRTYFSLRGDRLTLSHSGLIREFARVCG